MAGSFGVSRMTLRRAIGQLVSQGLLRRVQGRGTFVSEQPPQQKAVGLTRWSFERIHERANVRQDVRWVEEISPGPRVANALHTMPGEIVLRVTRIL